MPTSNPLPPKENALFKRILVCCVKLHLHRLLFGGWAFQMHVDLKHLYNNCTKNACALFDSYCYNKRFYVMFGQDVKFENPLFRATQMFMWISTCRTDQTYQSQVDRYWLTCFCSILHSKLNIIHLALIINVL